MLWWSGTWWRRLKNVVGIDRDLEVVSSTILPTIGFSGIEVMGSG